MSRLLALGVSALLVLPHARGTPQSPGQRSSPARLLGVFDNDTGEPITGAEVIDLASNARGTTSKTGTVALGFVPLGTTLLAIRKFGYQSLTMTLTTSPADTVPLTVVLSPLARQLDTVRTQDSMPRVISPGLREFNERRLAHTGGHFITADELRKSESRPLQNVIREIPGLLVRCARRSTEEHLAGECWAIAGRAASRLAILGGECAIDVYVDGALASDNNLNRLKVSEFAGVEYYAGGASVPSQYNKTGSACGVLLLWTRER